MSCQSERKLVFGSVRCVLPLVNDSIVQLRMLYDIIGCKEVTERLVIDQVSSLCSVRLTNFCFLLPSLPDQFIEEDPRETLDEVSFLFRSVYQSRGTSKPTKQQLEVKVRTLVK